jgi:hypothetical protein
VYRLGVSMDLFKASIGVPCTSTSFGEILTATYTAGCTQQGT